MKKYLFIVSYLLSLSFAQDHWGTAIFADDTWKYIVPDNELNDRRLKARIRGHAFGVTYGNCTGHYDDYTFGSTYYKGGRYLNAVWNHGWR